MTEDEKAAYVAELETKNESLSKSAAHFGEKRKKLAEMTEEEKSKLTAEETRLRKVEEDLEARGKEIETRTRLEIRREESLRRYTGGDAEVQKKIDAELSVLNMPETTPEEIEAKVSKAARLAGLTGSGTPSLSIGGGEGPTHTEVKKKFPETEQGKQTYKQMFGAEPTDKK
jgi:chromosome segregation ATPase